MNMNKEYKKNLAAIDCDKCRKEWADGCDGLHCEWENYERAKFEQAVDINIDERLGK